MQKIFTLGDSAAVTIPEEYLQKLGIGIGDDVWVSINGSTLTIESLKNKVEHTLT